MILTKTEKLHLGKMLDDELFAKFLDGMYEDGKEDMVNSALGADPSELILLKMSCRMIKKIKDSMKEYLVRAREPIPENQ